MSIEKSQEDIYRQALDALNEARALRSEKREYSEEELEEVFENWRDDPILE